MSSQPRRVYLSPAARTAIATEANQALPNETGGVLVGYRQGDDLVVSDAVAISSAKATPSRYVRDDVEANSWLATYLANREPTDPVGYIGEWHSHPLPSAPSNIDLRSIRATAKTTSGPIALIVYSPFDDQFIATTATRSRLGRIVTDTAPVQHPTRSVSDHLPARAVNGDGPISSHTANPMAPGVPATSSPSCAPRVWWSGVIAATCARARRPTASSKHSPRAYLGLFSSSRPTSPTAPS